MNQSLRGIWEHIRDLGLCALAHANRHAAYANHENPRWHELSVLQAAHAAELLVKARIAQEHPLLIFDKLPSSTQAGGDALHLEDLFQSGRTLQWSSLPDRLWAATGSRLPARSVWDAFGKLRNSVQHFAAPTSVDASEKTLEFIFEVVDPFINNSWGLYAVDYDEDYDPYIYFIPVLVRREIAFLVSPGAASRFEHWDIDWPAVSDEYRQELEKRVERALASA